jgi:HlyD family secretion protein
VHIHINEKELLRPGMSVTAEIETRYRTNVLTVPLASVTTRLPKIDDTKKPGSDSSTKLEVEAKTNSTAGTNSTKAGKKSDALKPVEVVFIVEGDRAKMMPVKIGVSDDNYYEITEGLQEGQEVVSGSYRAIGRELEDGKRVEKGLNGGDADKKEL